MLLSAETILFLMGVLNFPFHITQKRKLLWEEREERKVVYLYGCLEFLFDI